MSTDPDLPQNLQAQLASALEQGAKPVALSPLQARYTTAPAGVFARLHIRGGTLAFAAGAVAMLVVLAMVGNPAPRTWIVRSVNSAVQRITEPEPSPSPSPENKGTAGETPHPSSVPTAANHATPEAKQSPEPSHEPIESPKPAEPHESPRPVPSESPGGGGNGHDQQPSPSPSPTSSDEGHH